MNIRDLKIGDKIKFSKKHLAGLFNGVVEHLFYENGVVNCRDEEGTLYSVGISWVKAVETPTPAQTKVKIVDLPLGSRFKFDLSGGVWVLLDKGLRGTCILEGCNTCSTVNVAETAEAFANMRVYAQAAHSESHKNPKPTEDTTIRYAIRYAEFDGKKLQPPMFSSGSLNVGGIIEIDHTTFQTARKNQATAYIKSSLDELLKEAENLGVEVKVESTKSYVVDAK